MEYIERREGRAAVIRMQKPLARGNYHDLPGKLIDALGAGGAGAVVLDLCDVEFMDTTGLNTLLTLLEIAKSAKAPFAMCNAVDGVRAALERLTLSASLNLQPDMEKAVAFCGGA